jgi:ankyrin repeat protein
MSTFLRMALIVWLLLPACTQANAEAQCGDDADNEIWSCIQDGNVTKLKALLKKNPSLATTTDKHGRSPLRAAVDAGFPAIADALVAAGAKWDIETASAFGKTRAVAALLKEKPWLVKPPKTPLHYAAGGGHLEVVKLLLKHGADPNLEIRSANGGSRTPLSNALGSASYEIAKFLCEHGSKLNVAIDKSGGGFYWVLVHLDPRFVKLYLEYKANPNERYKNGLTPLHITARWGDIDKARLLLDCKADINVRTDDGATPLFFAAALRRRAYCEFLLKRGARLDVYSACALGKTAAATSLLKANPRLANTRDKRLQHTPLFWAVESGDVKLVELLLSLGAEVNLRAPVYSAFLSDGPEIADKDSADKSGATPLHVAVNEGHLKIVRLLLDKGAKVSARDGSSATPLHVAAWEHHAEIVKLLLEKGSDPNAKDFGENTPLHLAYDDKVCVKLLLAAKADPNVVSLPGETPLSAAAYHGVTDVAELLLANGAKLDLFSACLLGKVAAARKLLAADPKFLEKLYGANDGVPPINLASLAGQTKVVRLLLDRGAKYDPAKVEYPSPMHQAAMWGRSEVVQLFLDKGVSVNAFSKGNTALMAAATCSQVETVRFLLGRKADARLASPKTSDPASTTALHNIGIGGGTWGPPRDYRKNVADGPREVVIARMLIQAGADVNAADQFGYTPLHRAVEREQLALAAELLARGARVDARDMHGVTPIGMIRGRWGPRAEKMMKLLRDKGAKE